MYHQNKTVHQNKRILPIASKQTVYSTLHSSLSSSSSQLLKKAQQPRVSTSTTSSSSSKSSSHPYAHPEKSDFIEDDWEQNHDVDSNVHDELETSFDSPEETLNASIVNEDEPMGDNEDAPVPNWDLLNLDEIYDSLNPVTKEDKAKQAAWKKTVLDIDGKQSSQ